MLITTRETRRWMVPRGWLIKKLGPLGTGLREAFEEAGVAGEGGPAIGSFRYLKRLRSGQSQAVRVELFAMAVNEQADDWPERAERIREWYPHARAAELVEEPELRELLAVFPEKLASGAD
ncbi:NUDIX hydrolase [Chelatococcus sambhunathii]|uniref:NUDIX hydrolase n=1 Tax=Chelatococcus sambhunathii TaxID=363953 RepID=A0ABU1DE07_9HYPH|nr:NUDIX hydrolase [Chelatococcus sambhunathii]